MLEVNEANTGACPGYKSHRNSHSIIFAYLYSFALETVSVKNLNKQYFLEKFKTKKE